EPSRHPVPESPSAPGEVYEAVRPRESDSGLNWKVNAIGGRLRPYSTKAPLSSLSGRRAKSPMSFPPEARAQLERRAAGEPAQPPCARGWRVGRGEPEPRDAELFARAVSQLARELVGESLAALARRRRRELPVGRDFQVLDVDHASPLVAQQQRG